MKQLVLSGATVLAFGVSAGFTQTTTAQLSQESHAPEANADADGLSVQPSDGAEHQDHPVKTESATAESIHDPEGMTPSSLNEESSSIIEEIVVTAQRREQKLQDVPISVSAVTAESLETMGIDATGDIGGLSPGLTIQRQIGAMTPFIRGIGAATITGGQESPVSLYVDGFYVPQLSALNFSFNNIQRVEVIKGPQGTLFGRNATGGLIQIVTRDPSATRELQADLSYDDYQTVEARAYASTGITDTLATDLSLIYADQHQGYGRNLFDNSEVGKRREGGVRNTWLWSGEATQVRLGLDAMDVKSDIGSMRHPAKGARGIDGQPAPADYWDINADNRPFYTFEGSGLGLRITHDLGSMKVVSLSGARKGDSITYVDQDSTPLFAQNLILSDENKTFSQELQLVSGAPGPLSWIVGLYYFQYDVDYDLVVASPAAVLQPVGGGYTDHSVFDTVSYSAYAQGTYTLGSGSNLSFGLRYTADERDFDARRDTFNGVGSRDVPASTQKAEEPSWRLALDHRFSSALMAYASYNRGFKSGVYNTTNIDAPPVDSETVDAFELGIKTDLLDRRLRLNAAGFYYDYRDLQVLVITATGASLSNAPKAQIYGAELEMTAIPVDNLDLSLGLAWLESEYKDYPGATLSEPKPAPQGGNYTCTSGQTVATSNCPEDVRVRLASQTVEGNELARAPGLTATLSGRYAIPTSFGEFAIGGSIVHTGEFYWEPDNRATQDAFSLVNARLEWTRPDDALRIYLFGKNLTNEEYTQYFGGGTSGDMVAPQPPRTLGLGAELRFR